jgi:hypothetical protein
VNRTIELAIDSDTMVSIAEITGNQELFNAIGYLSQWNLPLAKVRLLGGVYDGNPELTATYWRYNGIDPQPIAYQIGAVWHGDHFGFHS